MTSLVSKSFLVIRSLTYSAAFVWLWTWLALSVRTLDATLPISLPRWLFPIGFLMASAGAVLAGTCIVIFLIRGRGTPAPFDAPREFVVSGPYRYVRNPMYVGAIALMLGAGLALSSASVVLLAFASLFVMHLFVIVYEEPTLSDRFGASYREYRTAVPRWLIRIPKADGLRRDG